MSLALTSLLLLAQVAPAGGGHKSLVEPFKVVLPAFKLNEKKVDDIQVGMTRQILLSREDFLNSQQAKAKPETLGLFFGRSEYSRMRGNAVAGYWWVSPKFIWKPDWKAVEFTAPKGVHPTSRQINPLAWNKAMEIFASQNGLSVGKSPIRVTGAVVWAATSPGESQMRAPATVCEWRIQSPEGVLIYRFGVMKPNLGAAILGNISWVMGFARGINGVPKNLGNGVVFSGTAKEMN